MTKMYIDRSVLEQALEFVTSEGWGTTPYMDVRVYEDAARLRDVLQAALAQQAEQLNLADPAVQKRLASQWGYVPAAAQAEPVEEPVAWHYRNNGGASVMHWGPSAKLDTDMQVAKEYPNAHKVTPLYTAPPRRKMVPLTEDEIYHATGHCGVSRYTAVNITRAVEQAHGIKE